MRTFETHVVFIHGGETADHASFLIETFLAGKGVHYRHKILNGKEIPGDYDKIESVEKN